MASKAYMLVDSGQHPIPVLGSKEGTGFLGSVTSDDNTDPVYITDLEGEQVYELAFFDSADLPGATSSPVNCYVRPGGVASTAEVTTSSFLHPARALPLMQVKLEAYQHSIGILSSDASLGVTVFWRRLI